MGLRPDLFRIGMRPKHPLLVKKGIIEIGFFPLGGLVHNPDAEWNSLSEYQKIFIAICGPLANLLTGVVFLLFYKILAIDLLKILGLFNILVFFLNLIPLKPKNKKYPTDGYYVLGSLRNPFKNVIFILIFSFSFIILVWLATEGISLLS